MWILYELDKFINHVALSSRPFTDAFNAPASRGTPHMRAGVSERRSGDSLSECLSGLFRPPCTWPGPGRVATDCRYWATGDRWLPPGAGDQSRLGMAGGWPIREQDSLCVLTCAWLLSHSAQSETNNRWLWRPESNTISVKSQLISRQSLVIEQYQVQVWPS